MTTSNHYDAALPIEYGAREIKQFIGKFTLRGFLITTTIIAVLLTFFLMMQSFSETDSGDELLAPVSRGITFGPAVRPIGDPTKAPPPPIPKVINTGPIDRAGNPIPVPDAMIKPDMKDFATFDVQNRASAEGSDGIDIGNFAPGIESDGIEKNVNVAVREKEPDMDIFMPVEKQPHVDLAELQKKVVYPEMARRAKIEGMVILRVLVDANGAVRRTVVLSSESEILNEAAREAIEKAAFTPAIQNSKPVMCWVSIPIRFRLK